MSIVLFASRMPLHLSSLTFTPSYESTTFGTAAGPMQASSAMIGMWTCERTQRVKPCGAEIANQELERYARFDGPPAISECQRGSLV